LGGEEGVGEWSMGHYPQPQKALEVAGGLFGCEQPEILCTYARTHAHSLTHSLSQTLSHKNTYTHTPTPLPKKNTNTPSGVLVIVVCTLGILPTLVYHIFPLAFNLTDTRKLHGKMLECRLQLSRGLILGMDLMVASDVVETLCGQVDLVKLVVIVAVRSWLGYERNHEMAHMTHEYDEIRKKTSSALKSHMGDVTKENLIEKINETFETLDNDKNGRIDASELKRAFDMVGAKASDKEVAGVLAHPRGMNRLEFAKLLRSMSFIKSLGTEKELDKIVEEIGEQGHVGAGADAHH